MSLDLKENNFLNRAIFFLVLVKKSMYFVRFVLEPCELYLSLFSFMMEREKEKAEISEKEKVMQQVG